MEDKKDYFEKMYIKYFDKAYQYALKLCQNEDNALDLMQESFCKAFAAFGKSEKKGIHFFNWIRLILHNVFIDKQRRLFVKNRLCVNDNNFQYYCHRYNTFLCSDNNIYDNLYDKYFIIDNFDYKFYIKDESLLFALSKISKKEQFLFFLKYCLHLTYAEIFVALYPKKLNISTLGITLHRIMKKIKTHVKIYRNKELENKCA